MKKSFTTISIALLTGWFCWVIPLSAQNISLIKKSARNATAGLSVKVENGKSQVVYKGKTVWTGKSSTKVTARSKTVNGKEYAAAYDGKKVVWENVKGASKQVQ